MSPPVEWTGTELDVSHTKTSTEYCGMTQPVMNADM